MNYKEAMEFISGTMRFGSVLGLASIQTLLMRLENPHKELSFIHIAGTNGKGSTASMTANILKEAGYKVGLYTSPYIIEFEERIQLCGEKIPKQRLAELTQRVKKEVEAMQKEGLAHPTEFEIITAIAMLYFKEEKADYVVLEVGLGGRLDATNVIENPLVCAICSISLDHTDILGDTLEKIAAEKAGIIKENSIVVIDGTNSSCVLDVIQKKAAEKNTEVIITEKAKITHADIEGTSFSYKDKERKVSLLGEHQVQNASIVLEIIAALKKKGIEISDHAVDGGLKTCKWIARFQKVYDKPLFIMDGAHNAAGMRTFTDSVKRYLKDKKVYVVYGMLKDKDYKDCAAQLSQVAEKIYTVTVDSPRALSAEELMQTVKQHTDQVKAYKLPVEAFSDAIEDAGEHGVICAVGSLYFMAHAKEAFFEVINKR